MNRFDCFPGYVAEKFGRKNTLLFSALPTLVSWIALAFSKSVETIYFARFLAGFVVGWIFTVISMYLAEIAHVILLLLLLYTFKFSINRDNESNFFLML
mgnify:CR=1 FL=1